MSRRVVAAAAVLAACSASGVQPNGELRVVEVAAGDEGVFEIEAPDPATHTFDVAIEATSGSPGPDIEWWFVSGTGRELAHVAKDPAAPASGEGCTTPEGEQGSRSRASSRIPSPRRRRVRRGRPTS